MLFIHGTSDTTIDCNHSLQLHKRCPEAYRRDPYILRGAGHDNVIEFDPERYFSTVGAFLQSIASEEMPRVTGEVSLTHTAPATPGGGPAATNPFLAADQQTPSSEVQPTAAQFATACTSESLTASWTR